MRPIKNRILHVIRQYDNSKINYRDMVEIIADIVASETDPELIAKILFDFTRRLAPLEPEWCGTPGKEHDL